MPPSRVKHALQAYRLALWALKVGHLLALRLCQVDALWMVPALQTMLKHADAAGLGNPGEGAGADSILGKAGAHHSSHLEHMIMKASGLYGSSHTQYLHEETFCQAVYIQHHSM